MENEFKKGILQKHCVGGHDALEIISEGKPYYLYQQGGFLRPTIIKYKGQENQPTIIASTWSRLEGIKINGLFIKPGEEVEFKEC